MKRGFTHKDLLLLLGILVAAAVVFTVVFYPQKSMEATRLPVKPIKTSMVGKSANVIRKLIDKVAQSSAESR